MGSGCSRVELKDGNRRPAFGTILEVWEPDTNAPELETRNRGSLRRVGEPELDPGAQLAIAVRDGAGRLAQ